MWVFLPAGIPLPCRVKGMGNYTRLRVWVTSDGQARGSRVRVWGGSTRTHTLRVPSLKRPWFVCTCANYPFYYIKIHPLSQNVCAYYIHYHFGPFFSWDLGQSPLPDLWAGPGWQEIWKISVWAWTHLNPLHCFKYLICFSQTIQHIDLKLYGSLKH